MINALVGSLFIMGLFFIFLALEAYFIVFNVSSILLSAGEIQAIIYVFELPPKELVKILVNTESL